MEGDADVRVEVGGESVSVLLEEAANLVGTVLADDGEEEHEAG